MVIICTNLQTVHARMILTKFVITSFTGSQLSIFSRFAFLVTIVFLKYALWHPLERTVCNHDSDTILIKIYPAVIEILSLHFLRYFRHQLMATILAYQFGKTEICLSKDSSNSNYECLKLSNFNVMLYLVTTVIYNFPCLCINPMQGWL